MNKFSKKILNKHDSYIDALKDAITKWETCESTREKRDYIISIGEIGREIARMNKALNIAGLGFGKEGE